MGILDRFRQPQKEELPEEVENYYKSQRRARVGMAWFLGFVALVVTLFVSLALFYGVRFVYRELTDSDETTQNVPQDEQQDQPASGGEDTVPQPQDNGGSRAETDSGQPDSNADQQPGQTRQAPRTGDTLPSNGDGLPSTGDPGM